MRKIGYDHYEQKVYCKYGNGTKNHYTYTPDLRRLDRMQALTSSDLHMYDNTYTFDLVGNILGLDNAASPVNGMGGGYSHGFSYDAFNRLAGATGSWLNAADNNYQLTMGYEGMHRIQSKHQQHNLNANPVADNDYQHTYLYEHPTKPNALTSIVANGQETETFTYDLNGNVLHHNRVGGESRKMAWDEVNRLKAINIADAAVQHHLYDAQGERGLKGLGTITEFYVNGETKGYGASLGNYVRYVSGYFVVDGHGRVSKHYYAGAERVLSRLAGDVAGYLVAEDLEGEQLSTLRSRQQRDVQAAIKTWDLQIFPFLNYPKPTDNCSLYPSGSEEHKQPAQTSGHHWIKEYESGSSGCLCDQQNTCTEVLYWYHPDHLGSSTFLSDAAGEPYQFVLYLPFGELFAEQRAAEWSTPYLFNAKELDNETGLYYYGARYYDPRVSMWFGVDPLANHPNQFDKSPYLAFWSNPVNIMDPDGRCPDCPDIKLAKEGDVAIPNGNMEFLFANGDWVGLGGDLPEVTVRANYMDSYVAGSTSSTIGAVLSAVSEVQYSEKMGTFLGNGTGGVKLYNIANQPNGATGSKALAKSLSSSAKVAGNLFSYVSIGLTVSDFGNDWRQNDGNLSKGRYLQFGTDLGVSGYGIIGGLPGAAVNIGWELGRAVTKMQGYQEWKQNSWLPYRQQKWGY